MSEKLPVFIVSWDRCKAEREPNESGCWGRCVLVKRHAGLNHVLWESPYGIPELVISRKPDGYVEF